MLKFIITQNLRRHLTFIVLEIGECQVMKLVDHEMVSGYGIGSGQQFPVVEVVSYPAVEC